MRLYTLAEARAMLPRVIPVLEELRETFVALRKLESKIHRDATHASTNGHLKADPWAEGARENRVEALNQRMRRAARQLAEWQIELKDPERGLIDFHHDRDGEVVYLCFELGESDINFWHRIADGYAGRQRIE